MRIRDDKKRQQILACAAKRFATQPFHKVKLEEIASNAGVGKGTLYIYFDSKEDLYFSIIYGGFAALVERLKDELSEPVGVPTRQRLRVIVEELVGFAFRHPAMFELMRSIGPPSLGRPEWAVKRRELNDLLVQTLRDGVSRGEFADAHPELTALFIPGLVRSAMLFGPKGLERQVLVDHILNLLETGICREVLAP
ncbi:MAG: TetR/AcrR family transcriptional regulator [Tepidisphaeraceae bacterium]